MGKISAAFKLRLLPFFIIILAVILIFKIADIINGTDVISNLFLIQDSIAEQQTTDNKDNLSNNQSNPSSNNNQQVSNTVIPDDNKYDFSPSELTVLQGLVKRREELDKRSQDIVDKENLLKTAEDRVNNKLDELKKLKDEVSKLLDQYNQKEDGKINSLVKIYENMKPKDAAKIFDELDMQILLQVLDKMKEAKAAPIIALMNPNKAKDLTTQFAEQRKLSTP